MKAFPSKTPAEAKICTFDFTYEAASGSTLSSPVVTKSLIEGGDTGAGTLTVGTPGISGMTLKVLVSGGTDGNSYKLLAQVTADNGEIHQLAASMKVIDQAA